MRHITTFFILIAVFLSQSATAQQWESFLSPPGPMANGKLLAIGDKVFYSPETVYTITATTGSTAGPALRRLLI